jgi:DNA invertase Pin-like site-specific DNA recombinase
VSIEATRVTLALLYRRVSTDEQAREGTSLPAQRTATRRYAIRRAWVIAGEFEDTLSGLRDDRAGYRALLARARELKQARSSVVMVVTWLDRFGRSVFERARCAEELRALDIGLHSISEGGQVPELVANLLAAVAAEESRRLRSRVSETRRHIAEAGWYFPGRAPWGYRWRNATLAEKALGAPTQVLEPDPERAPRVVEAFRRLGKGESLDWVRRWIRSLPAEVQDGRSWDGRSARRVLGSPAYIGRPSFGDANVLSRPRAKWAPLVADGLWCRVHRRLNERADPRRPAERGFLSGLVACPRCGRPTVGGRSPGDRSRYRCSGGKACRQINTRCPGTVPMRVLEALVLAEVGPAVERLLLESQRRRGWLRRRWRQLTTASDSRVPEQWQMLEREASDAKRAWSEAALQLTDGRISVATYQLRRDRAMEALEATRLQRADLEGSARGVQNDLDSALATASAWSQALQTENALAAESARQLVYRVAPRRLQHARYAVEIESTPLGTAVLAFTPTTGSTLLSLPTYPDVLLFRAHGRARLSGTTMRRRTRDLDALRQLPTEAFNRLPRRDRELIQLYCGAADGEPRTWSELAAQFGLQPCRVGQILRKWCPLLLGRAHGLRGWTVVTCSVCGSDVPLPVGEARRYRQHACGDDCRRELSRRRALQRARPHAGGIRALPEVVF